MSEKITINKSVFKRLKEDLELSGVSKEFFSGRSREICDAMNQKEEPKSSVWKRFLNIFKGVK